jgi:hypothetical protein
VSEKENWTGGYNERKISPSQGAREEKFHKCLREASLPCGYLQQNRKVQESAKRVGEERFVRGYN